mmetsp:Transcript_20602/g.64727  ORF Transcript_20602/g.64727 Transcript_20602/m.64727 type:complete len:358 (+) Transcript_20602:64-1137(+)
MLRPLRQRGPLHSEHAGLAPAGLAGGLADAVPPQVRLEDLDPEAVQLVVHRIAVALKHRGVVDGGGVAEGRAGVLELEGAARLVEHPVEEAEREVPPVGDADEGEAGPQAALRLLELGLRQWDVAVVAGAPVQVAHQHPHIAAPPELEVLLQRVRVAPVADVVVEVGEEPLLRLPQEGHVSALVGVEAPRRPELDARVLHAGPCQVHDPDVAPPLRGYGAVVEEALDEGWVPRQGRAGPREVRQGVQEAAAGLGRVHELDRQPAREGGVEGDGGRPRPVQGGRVVRRPHRRRWRHPGARAGGPGLRGELQQAGAVAAVGGLRQRRLNAGQQSRGPKHAELRLRPFGGRGVGGWTHTS